MLSHIIYSLAFTNHPSLKLHNPMHCYYYQHFVGKEIKARSKSPKVDRYKVVGLRLEFGQSDFRGHLLMIYGYSDQVT